MSDTKARARHDHALEEGERLHFARQRRVQRRLSRYDGRHPHPQPRAKADAAPRRFPGIRWRLLIVAVVGIIVVGQLYL